MSSELYYQRQILVDVKEADPKAFAIKMSHRFLSGVPDLMIKMVGCDPIFVEVKKGKLTDKGILKVGTTELQRNTMAKMVASGFKCEVWIVIDKYDGVWPAIVRVPHHVESVKVEKGTVLPLRKRGDRWPVLEFVKSAA